MLNTTQIQDAYKEVFPNSRIQIREGRFSNSIHCRGFLAKDKSECINGIPENDPMWYTFEISEDGHYTDENNRLYIKPSNGSYNAYGSAKIRGKTIKNITPEKLIERFKQIKDLVIENKRNFINLKFDINSKI